METLVEKVVGRFTHIDVLVNNAGVTRDGLLARMKSEDWDAVINTNLKGAFNLTRTVGRLMVRQRSGRIINISSVIGQMGNAGQANYAASKAGLLGFTKSVAREFASRGITCNAVCPGFIETDMTKELGPDLRAKLLERIPLGRFGQPADISSVVAFLALARRVLHDGTGAYRRRRHGHVRYFRTSPGRPIVMAGLDVKKKFAKEEMRP